MIQITDEEYEAVRNLLEWARVSHTNIPGVVGKMLTRIEAQKAPKGYLEKKIDFWLHRDNNQSVYPGDIRQSYEETRDDIVRIFEEEIAEAEKLKGADALGFMKGLKRRICGEG